MPLKIDVLYSEKDEAKALGAMWNPELKKWYVRNKYDYPKFRKWIVNDDDQVTIICDHLYIVEGMHSCFKCKKETVVIGFGIENYYIMACEPIFNNDKYHEYCSNEIHIASELTPLPDELLKYLKDKYNYYKSYSKTTQTEYYANHCKNCGIIQGNFFLFEEIDSPFFIDSKETAANLKLYKIPLRYDLFIDFDCGYGSEDYLIKKYGTIINLNLNLGL